MTAATVDKPQSQLRPADVVGLGMLDLRVKRTRALLTGLGIAIGIAAMVAVVGISASSKADLLAELDALGTNFLRVQPGDTVFGEATELPTSAPDMIRRVADVESASATRTVDTATVRRNRLIPASETGGIAVVATEPNLLDTLAGHRRPSQRRAGIRGGRAPRRPLPRRRPPGASRRAVVPGDRHPRRHAPGPRHRPLGADRLRRRQRLFGIDDAPSTIRVRTDPDETDAVSKVLAATATPSPPTRST